MKKFIKTYWVYITAIVLCLALAILKFVSGDLSDGIFTIAVVIILITLLDTRRKYDELWEDHEELIADYINELRSNINMITKTKLTLNDILNSVEEEQVVVPAKKKSVKKKVATKKKAVK